MRRLLLTTAVIFFIMFLSFALAILSPNVAQTAEDWVLGFGCAVVSLSALVVLVISLLMDMNQLGPPRRRAAGQNALAGDAHRGGGVPATIVAIHPQSPYGRKGMYLRSRQFERRVCIRHLVAEDPQTGVPRLPTRGTSPLMQWGRHRQDGDMRSGYQNISRRR
jgi:hypothetical protein